MATGIDVFFTGLMLICLDGQSDCPAKSDWNTAWIVKAGGPSNTCGWHSREETRLEIQFSLNEVVPSSVAGCTENKDRNEMHCPLPAGDINIFLEKPLVQKLETSVQRLPRLAEIDRRFKAPDKNLLTNENYVPGRINFPRGKIGAGDYWPTEGKPTPWYRSDDVDKNYPLKLSDRLKATYEKVMQLTLKNDKGDSLLVLKRKPDINANVFFRNVSKCDPNPDYAAGYDYLPYLLWYYRLGSWKDGKCPDYTRDKKEAVLLRCVAEKDSGCAYDASAARDTTFWPPTLGSSQF